MMFLAQSPVPTRFAYPEQHQIKGLNTETIAGILFPPPTWINGPEYGALRCNSENDLDLFSLNLSIYNQTIVPSE